MTFLKILKDHILQLNFHTFIGFWAQFEELYGPFVNLRAHLPPKHNSPNKKRSHKLNKEIPHICERVSSHYIWFQKIIKRRKMSNLSYFILP